MAKFFITLHKGHQSHCEHVDGEALGQRLHELMIDDNWIIDNVERVENQPIVRYGSEGQRVEYDDPDDASEHFLRMAEGWC